MTDQRRVPEDAEAAGPTPVATLERLRADDASVAEFVVAGGLPSFRPLTTYYVAEIRDGKPVQSFNAEQLFDTLDDAIAEARSLSLFGRFGVFELATKVVFE